MRFVELEKDDGKENLIFYKKQLMQNICFLQLQRLQF